MTSRVSTLLTLMFVLVSCGPSALSRSTPGLESPRTGAVASLAPTAELSATPTPGSEGYLLFRLTTTVDADRHEDLVALDVASGTMLTAPFSQDGSRWLEAAWTPAGDGLLVPFWNGKSQGTTQEWRVVTLDPGGPVSTIDFGGVEVQDVSMSPSGTWIAGNVHPPDKGTGYATLQRTDGSATVRVGSAGWLAWSHDGDEALILTEDRELLDVLPGSDKTVSVAGSVSALSYRPPVLWSPDDAEFLFRTDDCGACAMSRGSHTVRSLTEPSAGEISQIVGWTPSGLVGLLRGDTTELLVLSPANGAVVRSIARGVIADAVVSPDMGRVVTTELDQATGLETVAIYNLENGTARRFTLPEGVFLSHARWQPAFVPLPWPSWTRPGPDPTPVIRAGTLALEIRGALEASTPIIAQCEERGEGLGIVGSSAAIEVQLGVSPDGAPNFLSIQGPGFGAFAGKGFDVVPPIVVATAGSTLRDGSLTFTEVPEIDGVRTVSGTLRWSCSAA